MPEANIQVSSPIIPTPRALQLAGMFDIPPAERSELKWTVKLPLEEKDWQIGAIIGPSGCGKSTIARKLFGDSMVPEYAWPKDKCVLDGFPEGMPNKTIVELLSSVGFSSPPSWLRPFHVLSIGEQFRVTLARLLAETGDGLAVMDEFTSTVDRQVAQIGSAALAKTIRRGKGKFIAVTCHRDILEWLAPDWYYDPAADHFEFFFADGPASSSKSRGSIIRPGDSFISITI